MSVDLESIVSLRLRIARGPATDTPDTREFLRVVYGPLIATAQHTEVHTVDGRLVGFFNLSAPRAGRFGPPEASLRILLDPDSPIALAWALDLVERGDFPLLHPAKTTSALRSSS